MPTMRSTAAICLSRQRHYGGRDASFRGRTASVDDTAHPLRCVAVRCAATDLGLIAHPPPYFWTKVHKQILGQSIWILKRRKIITHAY